MNNYDWATLLLVRLPAPPGLLGSRKEWVARWMAAEEPPASWFHNDNPLNVNAGGSGSDTFPDLVTAGQATAEVIRQANMAGIHAALTDPAGTLANFSAAVVASPWASSHYGGDPMHIANIPAPPVVDAPGSSPAPPPPLPPEVELMDNPTFVRWCYQFLLVRPVDPGGDHDWEAELAAGMPRWQVFANIQDSAEGKEVQAKKRTAIGLPATW